MTDVPEWTAHCQHFDHPAYTRPAEQPPGESGSALLGFEPCARLPGGRNCEQGFGPLTQEPIRRLICQLTDIPKPATWRRGHTAGRLQADLVVDDAVSPRLSDPLLPEEEPNRAERGCAAFASASRPNSRERPTGWDGIPPLRRQDRPDAGSMSMAFWASTDSRDPSARRWWYPASVRRDPPRRRAANGLDLVDLERERQPVKAAACRLRPPRSRLARLPVHRPATGASYSNGIGSRIRKVKWSESRR
jgi:hypothetical protein